MFSKEKVLKCVIVSCKFNKPCPGCTGITTPHYLSDNRCELAVKNWQSLPKNCKSLFEKLNLKEKSIEEIVQICPNHFEFYQKVTEMIEKFENGEMLDAIQIFNMCYRKFYECKDFFFGYFTKVFEIFIESGNNFEENSVENLEKISVCLKIFSFAIMKNMKIKDYFRKNDDLINMLLQLLKFSEENIKIKPKIKSITSKSLFLLTNFNNLSILTSTQLEELFDFCLRNLDNDDFELYFHIISCLWGLSYDENTKNSLKKLKETYFFKFFNENNEKFDIQFTELILGFLFFVYGEEIKEFKAGKLENTDIDKFMMFMEKKANVYSYRVNGLFE